MWSGWVAYISFFRHVVKLDLPVYDVFRHYETAAQIAGPRFMHKRFWIVSDFPTTVGRDPRNRAHCESGPQIAWRDGWKSYSHHGVRIPGEWIENRASLTPQIALSQTNVELRRAACEILGWSKILAQLNAKTIDADPDPEIGTLLRVDLPDAPGEQFLKVRCGTGRDFVLPVPKSLRTARSANAWTWDMEAKQYKPEVRT